ncbi:hypothetical protein MBLNU457_5039t1 [Dothideomycetes sp. NU457]
MVHLSTYVTELEKQVQTLSAQLAQQPPSKAGEQESRPRGPEAVATPVSTDGNQTHNNRLSPSRAEHAETDTGHESGEDDDVEVNDVNTHTRSTEFHGPTSSMSFLSALQPQQSSPAYSGHSNANVSINKPSIVSDFHNNAFSPSHQESNSNSKVLSLEDERYHFRHAHLFLDGYFQNLHFIHPFLNRTAFLARCEDLWFGRSERQPKSFVALYYSVMSLGALVREWDRQELDGLGRFEWSRKLYQDALCLVEALRNRTDVDVVQCCIMMAKVCQNELNPHMAYMWLGNAARISLSAGHNRVSRRKIITTEEVEASNAISKLWWGLYSLEIETSFALGRPDSLGTDDYHNQNIPLLDGSETDIIAVMLPFARIVRKVSSFIYRSGSSVRDQTSKAFQLREELDEWLTGLPEHLQPRQKDPLNSMQLMKDPEWARRQRVVLELRYLNVNMVLFRPFLICAIRNTRQGTPELDSAVSKCVQAARRSIESMHEIFCKHSYFRTWWYNTTYILYAASIILCHASRPTLTPSSDEKQSLLHLIDMTLEILEVMDESVVAKKAAEMVRSILENVRNGNMMHTSLHQLPSFSPNQVSGLSPNGAGLDYEGSHIQMPDLSMDPDLDFINASLSLDYGRFNVWNSFQDSAGDFHFG